MAANARGAGRAKVVVLHIGAVNAINGVLEIIVVAIADMLLAQRPTLSDL